MLKILVIDDMREIGETFQHLFKNKNYNVILKYTGVEGIKAISSDINLIISDVKVPGADGFEILKYVKDNYSDIPIIIITAFGDIETAKKALKGGAFDFITKPFNLSELENIVDRALSRKQQKNNSQLKNKSVEIIGKSDKLKKIIDFVDATKDTDSMMIIYGESGTGKELIARRIHECSHRHYENFVAVNCAAIPFNLLESELFGFEKGAFTGAYKSKEGLFEIANNGTIFLDEIGEIHPMLQVKLLRIIQEGQFYRIGATKPSKVNTRIIAATNKNLQEMVARGEFRDDLYYRINILPIYLPPLRERKEDIPVLVDFFLNKLKKQYKINELDFKISLIEKLTDYEWPGNIRELENVIERIFLVNRNKKVIDANDIPLDLMLVNNINRVHTEGGDINYKRLKQSILFEFDIFYLKKLLKKAKGNLSKASRISGIERKNLFEKLRKYEIEIKNYR